MVGAIVAPNFPSTGDRGQEYGSLHELPQIITIQFHLHIPPYESDTNDINERIIHPYLNTPKNSDTQYNTARGLPSFT